MEHLLRLGIPVGLVALGQLTGLAGVIGLSSVPAIAPAHAQTASDAPVEYLLKDQSSIDIGCFGPCACPVSMFPLRGTFVLTRTDDDPLFTTYSVEDVDWHMGGPGTQDTAITGSGIYRIGGEFALEHNIALDLAFDGGAPRHFESGRVIGGSEFPAILIDAPAHGYACYRHSVRDLGRAQRVRLGLPRRGIGPVHGNRPEPLPNRRPSEFPVAIERTGGAGRLRCERAGGADVLPRGKARISAVHGGVERATR